MRRLVAAAALVLVLAAVGWYLTAHRGGRTAPPGAAVTPATTDGAGLALAPEPGAARLAATGAPPSVDGGPGLPPLDCDAPAGDVVRVGDAAIAADAVCRELLFVAGRAPRPPASAWRAQARQLRDQLVDALLVHQALAGNGVQVAAADVESALAAVRPGAGAAVAPSGAEDEVLRRQLRARLELARLIALRAGAELTDAELRAAYDQDPVRFAEPGHANVTPFVRRLPRSAAADEVAAAEQRVDDFAEAVAAGTAPAQAARAGGLTELAPFVLEDRGIEPALRAAAFGLAPGRWTDPTRTSIGWVVLRVDAVHPGKVRPFEQVRDRVRASLVAQARLDQQEVLLRELRAAAVIVDLVAW